MPHKFKIVFLVLFFGIYCHAYDFLESDEKTSQDSLTTIVKTNEPTYSRNFSKNFKEQYKDADFVYETQKESESLWTRFLRWLNELFSLDKNPDGIIQTSKIIAYIVKIALYILIGITLIYIVKLFLYKDGSWWFTKNPKLIETDLEAIDIDINKVNFEEIISNVLENNDYRLAIRYYYLWLLKKLSDKNYIDWHPEKTNREYLYEIKFEKNRKDFAYASQIYEYTWYGMFDLKQYEFELAKSKFQKIIQEL